MWASILVACCAKCAVLAVDTVDDRCPSQQRGAVAHGMPEHGGHYKFSHLKLMARWIVAVESWIMCSGEDAPFQAILRSSQAVEDHD